jgi:hypothetical protein
MLLLSYNTEPVAAATAAAASQVPRTTSLAPTVALLLAYC